MASRESRFGLYVDGLIAAAGHADRAGPLRAYCTGLLLPGERKSVEPMAARIAPRRAGATHQAMHHFVANAEWSDATMLAAVRGWVLPKLTKSGPIEAWIVDDTGFPKKGTHSVGVARQYCGQLGKPDNCQVAVSLSVATAAASLPIAFQLYLPEDWAADPIRRRKVGVPEDISFSTKPIIALMQIEEALAAGVPAGVVVADAGYGVDTRFRDVLRVLKLDYVVGIQGATTVREADYEPLPPKPYSGRGQPSRRLREPPGEKPIAVSDLALTLPDRAWRKVTWREGTKKTLASRFAAVRIRAAHRDTQRQTLRAQEWLLIEWPKGESEPTKYFFSSLSADTPIKRLVHLAKLRWRIERDYQDLKQEVGLGHYEGRGWRGFHHHATLAIAAYGFLVSERSPIPPSARRWTITSPRIPKSFVPRGSPAQA